MDESPEAAGTRPLREVARAMFLVRSCLEHGNVAGARDAARSLLIHLDALPVDRAEYERLCELADEELERDGRAWDASSAAPPAATTRSVAPPDQKSAGGS